MRAREFVLTMALMMGLASCGPIHLEDFLDPFDEAIFEPVPDEGGNCPGGLVKRYGNCVSECRVAIANGQVTNSHNSVVSLGASAQPGIVIDGAMCASVRVSGTATPETRDLHLRNVRTVELQSLNWKAVDKLSIQNSQGTTRILVKSHVDLPDEVSMENGQILVQEDAQLRLVATQSPKVKFQNVSIQSQSDAPLAIEFPEDKLNHRWAEQNKSYQFINTKIIGARTPIELVNYPLMEVTSIQLVQGDSPFTPRIELNLANYHGVAGVIMKGQFFMTAAKLKAESALTILAGATIKMRGSSIHLAGAQLISLGTAQEPVILTSYFDDTAGGDLNGDGAISSPASYQWKGLHLFEKDTLRSKATLKHTEVRYAGINVVGSDLDMNNSTIKSGLVCTNSYYNPGSCSSSYLTTALAIIEDGRVKMTGTNVIRDADKNGIFINARYGDDADTRLEVQGPLQMENIWGENLIRDETDPGTVIGLP